MSAKSWWLPLANRCMVWLGRLPSLKAFSAPMIFSSPRFPIRGLPDLPSPFSP